MKYLHRFWIALGVACLPVAAQAEASGFPGVDDPKLAKAIDEAMERPKPRFCEELAPLWAEAAQRSKAPNDNLMVMSANAMIMCAVEKERFEDASNLIIRTEAKFGQQVFFHRLALALHSHLRELDLAVARVSAISTSNGGALLTEIDPAILFELSRNLLTAKRADLREAMWSSIQASPVFMELDPDVRNGAALNLLDVKAEAGTLSSADTKLVDLVTSSSPVISILADRRYAPIWTYVEERAGDGLAKLIEADLKLNAERYEAKPEEGKRLSSLGYSMLQAGEVSKLIDMTARFRDRNSDYSQLDEDGAWIVDYMAIALRVQGRQQEGIAALDKLASLKPETHPWVVNYVINHATALGEDLQDRAALRSLDRAAPIADRYGSPYARALVAGQRACSHHRLGQADKAAEQVAVLEGLRADAPNAVIGYAMCAGRDDLAIAWAREALARDSTRRTMIELLQPAYMQGTPSSVTDQEPYLLLAKSPELASAFDKVARVVPERFAPLGGRVRIVPGSQPRAK